MNYSLAALSLGLLSLPGVGRRTVHRLLSQNSAEPQIPLEQVIEHIVPRTRSKSKSTAEELKAAIADATQLVERSEELGGTVLDFDYLSKTKFADLKDPPILLFAKGDTSLISAKPVVLIIGTRKPQTYSTKCAARFVQRVVEMGFITSSGLAVGCDSVVHKETLKNGGSTIAVLPSGTNNIFPRNNASLAKKIAARGLLLSEYPCDQDATRYSYVERDRLQAGLSDALILVQSSAKGGSMHACREMLDLGRPVAALSRREFEASDFWAGNEWLLSQPRTHPLADGGDLMDFLQGL